jgi:hypothetical protein
MALDASLFSTRNALEGFAIRHANSLTDFIAEEIFSPAVVNKTASKKYQYDSSNLKSVYDIADSKASANKVEYGVFTSPLTTQLRKLAMDIDPHDERNADQPVANIEQRAAQVITEKLLIRREQAMVTKVSTANNYPSSLTATLGAAATWASADGNPETDSATARAAVRAACGVAANALALSWTGLEQLKQSPALKDRLKYTSGESLSEQQIKNLMMVEHIHVCKARVNTAIDGAADAVSDIWDDFALFYVKDPTMSLDAMSYGRFYVRNNLYSHLYEDPTRGSGDGRIKVLEMGWEWALEAGAVVSATDGDFTAGYYLDNIY